MVAIAAGDHHNLALKTDGTVVQWPDGTNVPPGLTKVVRIYAGGNHSVAFTRAPFITTHPASQTVVPGANVTFTVGARSRSAMTYQWQRNGTNLVGATEATLTLSSVTIADSGFYTVVVANETDGVTSLPALLVVGAPAILTVVPEPIEDQSQKVFGGWVNMRDVNKSLSYGQTFTPATAGRLERLFFVGCCSKEIPERPTTIAITDTVDGKPGTNVLGRAVAPHLLCGQTVSFAGQDVYLVAERLYAIVFSTEAPRGQGATYSFQMMAGDSYTRGALWRRTPTGPWVPAQHDVQAGLPLDLLFTTYMFAGIPPVRLASPRDGSRWTVGEVVELRAVAAPDITPPFTVSFYAGSELLGTASEAAFVLPWTPSAAGSYDLKATLAQETGTTFTSAVARVTVVLAGPANDRFANRALLEGEYEVEAFSNEQATVETGEPRPVLTSASQSVWWTWTAPRSALATVVVEPPHDTNAVLAVYTGSAVDALFGFTNGLGRCTFSAQAGVTYQIAVDSRVGSLLDASLVLALTDVELTAPAKNSVFRAPVSVAMRGTRTGTARGPVTVEFYANETLLGVVAAEPYERTNQIIAPGYYALRLKVRDARSVTTESVPVPIVVRPANDNFADAEEVAGYSVAKHASNAAATRQGQRSGPWDTPGGELIWADNQGGHSIWYRWVPPEDGLCTIGGEGANFSLLLSAHVGATIGTIMPVASNAMGAPSPITFEVAAGKTYHISVDGFFGEEGELDWWLVLRPRNDDFARRQQFRGVFYEALASFRGATLEPEEAGVLGTANAVSLWWSWTAPVSAPATLATRSIAAQTRLAVFTGTNLSSLRRVADAGAWSLNNSARFAATQATTYHFAVLGLPKSTTDFTLSLQLEALRLANPLDGSVFAAPANLALSAVLDGPATPLRRVDFWANRALIGSVEQPPYALSWNAGSVGTHTLHAEAIAPDGTSYTSLPATILIYTNEDLPAPRVFAAQRGHASYVLNAVGALSVFGAVKGTFGLGPNADGFWPNLASQPPAGGRWLQVTGGKFDVRHVHWALDDQGRLYKNGTEFVPFPEGVQRWMKVFSGFTTALTLADNGRVYRDGRNPVGFAAAGSVWSDVGEGYGFSATLDLEGRAFLHRADFFGQPVSSDEIPIPQGVSRFVVMAVGGHAFLLLGDDGQLYEVGRLTESFSVEPVPRRVGLPTGVSRWVMVSASGYHALAIASDGELYAWGRNYEDQLGIGGGAGQRTSPVRVPRPPGVTAWTSISAGYMHSLAIGNDCNLYAWGSNFAGELGVGPLPSQPLPARVANLGSLCGIPVVYTEGETALLPDGSFRVRFSSDLNRSYLIQYSEDMRAWKTAFPPVNGTGGVAEWIDDGPPKTETHPRLLGSRFYRVIFGP